MWTYSEAICPARRAVLSCPPSFNGIAASIAGNMQVLCGHNQQSYDRQGFACSVYCVQISESLFDLFFNSTNGYRAQYFQSVQLGVLMNTFLIQSLIPALIGSARLNSVPMEPIE